MLPFAPGRAGNQSLDSLFLGQTMFRPEGASASPRAVAYKASGRSPVLIRDILCDSSLSTFVSGATEQGPIRGAPGTSYQHARQMTDSHVGKTCLALLES